MRYEKMERRRCWSTVIFVALLLMAASASADRVVADGQTLNVGAGDDPVTESVWVQSGGTLILSGGTITSLITAVTAEAGSTVEIRSGIIDATIVSVADLRVDPGANVTFFGASFVVDNVEHTETTLSPEEEGTFTIKGVSEEGVDLYEIETYLNFLDEPPYTIASVNFDQGGAPPANQAPVADAGADVSVAVGQVVTLDGTGSADADGDALTYAWSLTTIPAGSTAALSDPTAVQPTFTVDVFGDYVAQLVVNDGTVDSVADTVTISMLNRAPVAVDDSAETTLNRSVTVAVLDNDSDPDEDLLTVALESAPGNGTATVNDDGTVTYTPGEDFVGPDAFTYTISDGNGSTATATVTVAVNPGSIGIDIRPGDDTNRVNLGSNGVIPVAILSTATFDATELDADKIFLAGSGVRVRGRGDKYLASEEDVDGDGLLDLVVKIETQNLDPDVIQDGIAYLRVHAAADSDSPVLYEGSDSITIVPPGS